MSALLFFERVGNAQHLLRIAMSGHLPAFLGAAQKFIDRKSLCGAVYLETKMGVQAGSMQAQGEASWIYGEWVQPPAQDRSERTFFRFLDAAEELLSAKHWHEVSVQQIVRRARASVGSFYNRFNDKAALLHCLDDRLGQECELTIVQLMEEFERFPALMAEAPAIVMSVLIRLCTERSGVIRALDLASKMSGPDTFKGLGPRFDGALETLAQFLTQNSDMYKEYSVDTIAQAFREAFWIARENLLYEKVAAEHIEALHQNLQRHFMASLRGEV